MPKESAARLVLHAGSDEESLAVLVPDGTKNNDVVGVSDEL